MTCPHCGYDNPEQAAACLSCSYLLRPPNLPRRDSRFAIIVVSSLLVIIIFIGLAVTFSKRADSMISFYGKRRYFDLAAGSVVLAPGDVKTHTLRNAADTPVCRFYGSVSAALPGVTLMVIDSANLAAFSADQTFSTFTTVPISGSSSFAAQTSGGGNLHHVVLHLDRFATDSVSVLIERMQAACFERW